MATAAEHEMAPDVAERVATRRAEKTTQADTERAIEEAHSEARRFLADGILLGGVRWFAATAPTFEHERYRVAAVKRAGAMPLLARYNAATDDPDQLAADLLQAAFERSALFDLLATLLVQEGMTWSPKVIAPNALRFASLSDAGDLARLEASVLWVVLDFFLSLAKSSPISLKSLRRSAELGNQAGSPAPEGSQTNPPAISRFGAESSDSAAPTTSATGTP